MYVDIDAVHAELGRQPYSAHDFLVKYQDRVLMGKDIYEVSEYKWYFRALETRDEYFEYRSEEHTSELQSRLHLVCRLLLEKKKSVHQCAIRTTMKLCTYA